MDAKEVKEKTPQWMKRLEVKESWQIKSRVCQKEISRRSSLYYLIHEPDLIIWIHTFSGLDPVNTELLKQGIFQERARAIHYLSDHVMTNVEELCDDILMIRDGQVVLHGPVQDVRRNQYGKTSLCFSERSKEELQNLLMSNRWAWPKQGSWKLTWGWESWKELFPILTQAQYIATFDQQCANWNEEIF